MQFLSLSTNRLILHGVSFSRFLGIWVLMAALLLSDNAHAVPSFSRQTGEPCSSCHTQSFGPNLNSMGREFKLNGYTLSVPGSGINSKLPHISGMVQGSFTHLDNKLSADDITPGYHSNNNVSFDQASLFYAGQVYSKLGAMVQLTYSGVDNRLALDNSDIRIADNFNFGKDNNIVYGVSFNNSPTVQDLWNTTPVWGYPYASSELAPTPGASTLIEGALAQNSGGATGYLMLNNLLYLEAGAYASFSTQFQRSIGIAGSPMADRIDGGAPYWRVALQHEIGGHYFEAGTFGLQANMIPGGNSAYGYNQYSDVGADANYQYLGSQKHIFQYKLSYIRENQKLSALVNQMPPGSSSLNNNLWSLNTNASYTYDQTYSVTLGYFNTSGSKNTLLYPGNTGSYRPNSEGFIAELDYVPFGKSTSLYQPWLNLRFALQYVGYTKFDGSVYKYDGVRNASSNNTLFLNGWLIF